MNCRHGESSNSGLDDREGAKLLVVAGNAPLAILDHLGNGGLDFGLGVNDVGGGELVGRASLGNVLKSGLERDELAVNLLCGSFGLLDSLGLEGVDGLDLGRHVVRHGLELGDKTLKLVNNLLVLAGCQLKPQGAQTNGADREQTDLEYAAVLGEVDSGRLGLKGDEVLLGVVGALLESSETRHGLGAEGKLGVDLGEVDGDAAGGQHGGRVGWWAGHWRRWIGRARAGPPPACTGCERAAGHCADGRAEDGCPPPARVGPPVFVIGDTSYVRHLSDAAMKYYFGQK